MNPLQRIDTLLELNVVRRELGLSCVVSVLGRDKTPFTPSHLVFDLADLLFDKLLRPSGPWCE